jgi:hypothetical protein
MSNLLKKVTSAVAGLAMVFTVVSPIAGVSAAYTSLEAANKLATLWVVVDQSSNPADYRLGDTISRREQVKLAMNLASCQAVTVSDTCTGKFSDLASSDWGCKYAESALSNGFVSANAQFGPTRDVSKVEALKMIMNATGVAKGSNASWQAAYVEWAVSAGVLDASFSDYNTAATRGWIFQAASEAVDLCGATNEEDDLLGDLLNGLDDTDTTSTGTTVTPPVVVTGGTAMISLSPENPKNGYVAVDTPRAMMMAFDVTAGSKDVTLSKATFYHVGLGDRTNVDNVTIYNSGNESVSKVKSFTNNDLDISFDKNIVVKAGETETFFVGATIADNGANNTTYQIRLTNIEASATVTGGPVTGAALVPTVVNNGALLKVTANTVSENITIGDEVKLAGFTVEETKDNEDVVIKTITLHQNGSIDSDYLSDLTLTAGGKVVATNLSVNSDDELVANIDYTLAANKKVKFELTGVVTGDVNETVHFEFEANDDIYAVGSTTGFNVGFSSSDSPADIAADNTSNSNNGLSKIATVEGAEIDASFVRSDIDSTKVNVDDLLVGTLKLTANTNDYEVKKIQVTVAGNGKNAIEDLKIDGVSFDTVVPGVSDVYTFKDITLTKGVLESLDLEADIVDNAAFNGKAITFDVKVAEVRDEENNITYNLTNAVPKNVSNVMSTNSFNTKNVKIETASFTLTKTKVNDDKLVLGNAVETVMYKGKISVGDSDDVTINDFNFTSFGTILPAGIDFTDVIDTVTLNIGGKTYDGDINANTIEFSSINHDIVAGSNNVEVLLTAVLQDNDSVVNNNAIAVIPSTTFADLEDSDGEELTALSVNISTAQSNITTLLDKGTFSVKVLKEVDTDDNLENTVLAGENSVVLAEIDIEANYEDIKVSDLTFKINGTTDFSDTIDNVRLVSGSKTLASGAIVSYVGGQTQIVFDGDNTFRDADNVISAELVADLNPITGQGDAVTAVAGNIAIASAVTTPTLTDVKWVNSNDDIVLSTAGSVNGEIVAVVSTKLVFSVVETLSNNGAARVKITADSGNNTVGISNEKPEVTLTSLIFSELSGTADSYRMYKEGDASTQTAAILVVGNKLTFNAGNFGTVDVVFDGSQTYVIVPTGTPSKTYSLVLSGNVATYNVDTVPVSNSTTTLDKEISLGSKTYSN